MQLYALDSNKQLINSTVAHKQINYFCLECKSIVRLRSGYHRQSHFYHLQPTIFCRQHKKGEIHLQLQNYLLTSLPSGEATLEHRFKEINRIADVAWHSKQIVFEVQCSVITAEEVTKRNFDYHQIGWQVVWILHDHRYNKRRLSAAEIFLQNHPHFFTNFNLLGEGIIYDQFDICYQGKRHLKLSPLPIHLPSILNLNAPIKGLDFYQKRKNISSYFEGDFVHLYYEKPDHPYVQEAQLKAREFLNQSFHQQNKILNIYHTLSRFWLYFLERICR